MKAKSLASYPSSPVTIQRHHNPRTVLHLRTDHSSMTEPRMIDQLDNKPIPIPSISDNPSIEDKTRSDKQLLSDNCFILWCWGGRAASCGYTAAPWPRYTARSAARTRWTSPRAQWITFMKCTYLGTTQFSLQSSDILPHITDQIQGQENNFCQLFLQVFIYSFN